jgi:hypothetical protein
MRTNYNTATEETKTPGKKQKTLDVNDLLIETRLFIQVAKYEYSGSPKSGYPCDCLNAHAKPLPPVLIPLLAISHSLATCCRR